MNTDSAQNRINTLFGSYRAEWLDDQVFSLFSEPNYFPELVTMRPCVLLGGRGTGKTTVLRCLSYEGQWALKGANKTAFLPQDFFGIFYRVDTNRVTAFRGNERNDEQWSKLFGHYLNLVLGGLFIKFLNWHHEIYPELPTLGTESLEIIAQAFNLGPQKDLKALSSAFRRALVEFEAHVNNIAESDVPGLTIQGAPLEVIINETLQLNQFIKKQFYFLLDEYENFTDYQQRCVNTLIKHTGAIYSIKIGVRELGWRQKLTISGTELLNSPADYIRISLTDKLEGEIFDQFAFKVCQARIDKIDHEGRSLDVKDLFPGLSDEEEAELLCGGELPLDEKSRALINALPPQTRLQFDKLRILEQVFLATWPGNQANMDAFADSIQKLAGSDRKTKERYENYKHSLLFWLRRKKSGIRKYYAGWNVFAKLAAGNIRFFLELIDRSLISHLQRGEKWGDPVSVKTQTETAQYVGRKNLEELEGLDVDGAKLTKLLLGLGRIFQVMATDPLAHSPEVNQFQLATGKASVVEVERARKLLSSAVNHLALIKLVGSKPSDPGDTKESDFMIHPIYSAFFCCSYRRKRKMNLSHDEILSLVDNPKVAINEVLTRRGRDAQEAPLPEQMSLFEHYYVTPE